jgi:anti-sigma B factor antagonist
MGNPRILDISVRLKGGATIVDLQGRIDIGNSTVLRSSLFEAVAATSRLALNMKGVSYIDSSGIATLVEVLKRAKDLKKDFVLFGLSPTVHNVLKLTRLLGIFQIFEDEEQALEGPAAP